MHFVHENIIMSYILLLFDSSPVAYFQVKWVSCQGLRDKSSRQNQHCTMAQRLAMVFTWSVSQCSSFSVTGHCVNDAQFRTRDGGNTHTHTQHSQPHAHTRIQIHTQTHTHIHTHTPVLCDRQITRKSFHGTGICVCCVSSCAATRSGATASIIRSGKTRLSTPSSATKCS